MGHLFDIAGLIAKVLDSNDVVKVALADNKLFLDFLNGPLIEEKTLAKKYTAVATGEYSPYENQTEQSQFDRGNSDLPQYFITQNFDFPTDFPNEMPDDDNLEDDGDLSFVSDKAFDAGFSTDEKKFSSEFEDEDEDDSEDESDEESDEGEFGDSEEEEEENNEVNQSIDSMNDLSISKKENDTNNDNDTHEMDNEHNSSSPLSRASTILHSNSSFEAVQVASWHFGYSKFDCLEIKGEKKKKTTKKLEKINSF